MQKTPHILVIRLSAMGDVAMTIPVLKSFVAQNPDVMITVLSRGFFQPLFNEIDNVSFFAADVKGKHKGVLGLYRLFKELASLKITAVADLHNVLRSQILGFYFSLAGYNVKKIDKGRAEKKALTREENKVFKPLKTTHQRYTDVFRSLGFSLELSPLKSERKELPEGFMKSDKKWIGFAPFAAHQGKMYPFGLSKKVTEKLAKEGFEVFLFGGGKKEVEQLNALEKEIENSTSLAGKLSFENELKFISNLDCMISMDSGNGHLSALYGVPTITLWGVTHPYAGFAPFGQKEELSLLPDLDKFPKAPTSIYGNKVPDGYKKIMETIAPEFVVEKVKSIL